MSNLLRASMDKLRPDWPLCEQRTRMWWHWAVQVRSIPKVKVMERDLVTRDNVKSIPVTQMQDGIQIIVCVSEMFTVVR